MTPPSTALSLVQGGSLAASLAAPELAFLGAVHPVYKANMAAWAREERRLYGGDPVLKELVRFDWEEENGPHYVSRQTYATYINLPKIHSALITGHVGKKRPKPGSGMSFGTLGKVRERTKLVGQPTRAELLYYNTDGVGQDGSEWAAWWDAAADRAEATGHRWISVEVPRRDPTLATVLSLADEIAGARPFLVEYSPLRVPNWWYHNGELQFAVIRPTVDEPTIGPNGTLQMPQLNARGYYLMVREGCELLGTKYRAGGWWLWNSRFQLIDNGGWDKTGGMIPLFPLFADADPGTDELPAISRSQTTEIGNAAVGIMNLISSRDWDAMDAASSKLFILGVSPANAEAILDQMQGSQIVCVPQEQQADGNPTTPSVHDGSQGAVPSNVFKTLLDAKFAEAQRLMVDKATADKASSGAKQVASFTEATAPLLTRRARYRQQAESTAIFFSELRWGAASLPGSPPQGYSAWPDEYELAPLIDSIDAALDSLRRAGATSEALVVDLLMQMLQERGVMPENIDPSKIEEELRASLVLLAANKSALSNLAKGIPTLQRDTIGGAPKGATLPPLPSDVPGGTAPPTTATIGAVKA